MGVSQGGGSRREVDRLGHIKELEYGGLWFSGKTRNLSVPEWKK